MTSRQVECGKTKKGPFHTPHGRLSTRNTKIIRKAKLFFFGLDVGSPRSALPSSCVLLTVRALWLVAHRLHASDTPLKNASVAGTRVSAPGLCDVNSEVIWFLQECYAFYPILTQEVVTGDMQGILGGHVM